MAERATTLDPNTDLQAWLREQHRRRRARFAAAKEPPPEFALVPGRSAGVVYLLPRTRLEQMAHQAKVRAMVGYFTPERMLNDYLAKTALDDVDLKAGDRPPGAPDGVIPGLTIQKIAKAVAKARRVELSDIFSTRRGVAFVRARQEVVWHTCKHTNFSLPKIGRALGGRDHTTILHSRRKFDALLADGREKVSIAFDHTGNPHAL